jgi:hypothetical protein
MIDEDLRNTLSICMHSSSSLLKLGPRKAYLRAMLPGGEPPELSMPPPSRSTPGPSDPRAGDG